MMVDELNSGVQLLPMQPLPSGFTWSELHSSGQAAVSRALHVESRYQRLGSIAAAGPV